MIPRLQLIPVAEAADVHYPEAWPPPLFAEANSFPDERELVIVRDGAALGMIALGPPAARVEVGYAVLEEFQNRGVASQALAAAVKQAFVERRTRELFARVKPDAAASIRVLQKNGFERTSQADGFVIFSRQR